MKVIEADIKLPIHEICCESGDTEEWRHSKLLPKRHIRAIVSGASNSGKTNLCHSLIYSINGISFLNLYVFSKSLYQPKYEELAAVMELVPEINYFAVNNGARIPSPENVEPFSCFIFDDIACEPQSPIREYFSMGRHRHCDVFLLSQSYAQIEKHLVRENANLIVLFKTDALNQKHVYDDHVSPETSFSDFSKICNMAWNYAPFSCLVINKESPLDNGRFRIGFDKYIIP